MNVVSYGVTTSPSGTGYSTVIAREKRGTGTNSGTELRTNYEPMSGLVSFPSKCSVDEVRA